MVYKTLGSSTLRISRIGFGCMSLKPGQDNVQKLVDEAIDNGINFFDTADLYDRGANEETIGAALKNKREKIVLATKVGNEWKADGSGWDWNPSKAYILKAIDKSLLRLQTDYIDLYQLHGGTIDDPIHEIIEAFELLQQQGKIRYYGISSIRPNVIRKYVEESNIVSVMMQYSLLDRRPEEACLDLLSSNNIGVLARGSLASGLLVDKPAKPYLTYSEEEVSAMQRFLHSISSKNNNDAHIALQFALAHPAVTAAVVGIRTDQHLQDAIDSVSDKNITEPMLENLKKVLQQNVYEAHR